MSEGLRGRVAVVTGAASGIGAAVAHRLRDAGVHVAALDTAFASGHGGGRSAASEDEGLSVRCDVGDAAAVEAAVARAALELGPPTLAVHAAGVTRDAMHWKLAPADWDLVLRVNLSGAFHLLRAVAPHLRAARAGSVVLVGSINGLRGKVGQTAYAASKAGLVGLAKSAARELGPSGARVNVVAPGLTDTPMTAGLAPEWRAKALAETALGRIASADDIAATIVFLLTNAACHVTGQVLNVDGGQAM